MKYGKIVIFGGSSGIGLATAEYLNDRCEELITLSRRPSPFGKWIKTDITNPAEIEKTTQEIGSGPIDGLLYLGGTWERNAFTDKYNFESCSDNDLQNVLDVNLLGPMRLIQKLLPNLRLAENPKIIITGAAIAELSLGGGKEVANTSSMLGLRGLVLALRENVKEDKIGVTLLKPGYIATPEVVKDFAETKTPMDYAIPLTDIFTIIESILRLSNRTNINEIEIPTML
ncbi:SDR family oxidoreductase [Ulvibacterium sp.]|uniref:SDR family NAD(P)-dependent oxidoreductase n=1 Tax=Ulvibacterium sp. TaxID=2665914 RepID=UPI00262847CF|nr:SDR family oxidoreductase [Ulvibacterium sp.]